MDRNSKISLAVILFIAGIFVLGMVLLTFKITTMQQSITQIVNLTSATPKVINGRDAYTPVKGVDYFDGINGQTVIGKDGKDGLNSMSINKETTIVKEVPLEGKPGKDGVSPESTQTKVQLNPDTNNLEIKSSTDEFWTIVVPCSMFVTGCPKEKL